MSFLERPETSCAIQCIWELWKTSSPNKLYLLLMQLQALHVDFNTWWREKNPTTNVVRASWRQLWRLLITFKNTKYIHSFLKYSTNSSKFIQNWVLLKYMYVAFTWMVILQQDFACAHARLVNYCHTVRE